MNPVFCSAHRLHFVNAVSQMFSLSAATIRCDTLLALTIMLINTLKKYSARQDDRTNFIDRLDKLGNHDCC